MITNPFSTTAILLIVIGFINQVECGFKINIPGRCPSICRLNITETFMECQKRVRSGCAMEFCNAAPSRATACELSPHGQKTVLPTEKVTISFTKGATMNEGAKLSLAFKTSTKSPSSDSLSSKIDVYFLIDSTVSMGVLIFELQKQFNNILKGIGRKADAAFGLGIYRDETELKQGFRNIQAVTKDFTALHKAIYTLEADGGLDQSEANLVAIYKVATSKNKIQWRDTAKKVIVLLGDNPGHEPTCSGRLKLDRHVVSSTLKEKDISMVLISYPYQGLNRKPTAYKCSRGTSEAGEGQGLYLAKTSGGSFIGINGDEIPSQRIVQAVGKHANYLSLARNTCSSVITFGIHPSLPSRLHDGQKVTLTIKKIREGAICKRPGAFTCQLEFKKGSQSLPPFRLTVERPAGC